MSPPPEQPELKPPPREERGAFDPRHKVRASIKVMMSQNRFAACLIAALVLSAVSSAIAQQQSARTRDAASAAVRIDRLVHLAEGVVEPLRPILVSGV